jgi:hypothetical protein
MIGVAGTHRMVIPFLSHRGEEVNWLPDLLKRHTVSL